MLKLRLRQFYIFQRFYFSCSYLFRYSNVNSISFRQRCTSIGKHILKRFFCRHNSNSRHRQWLIYTNVISVFTGIFFIFIVLHLICKYYGISLWKLLGYVKEEILIVLGSSSSEAVLPSLMQKLTAAGCEKEVVGLVVPTGYSFNLDGTTIYLSMSVIFLAQAFGIDLSLGQQLTVIGILLLTSKGAAGVTGSGFIVLASTLAALKVIPMEGLALLIGVDRFMSEGRAIINFIGNFHKLMP